MFKLVKKLPKKPVSLKNHFDRRNKVLIKRRAGGFGDILMQRMMFEDFNKINLDLTFACPQHFLEMAKNHPFVKAIDISTINETEYGAVYDITTACRVHEMKYAPFCQDHRSDIWAAHCGVTLTNHNMFLTPQPEAIENCQNYLKYINPQNKPIVILATKSGGDDADDFSKSKSLLDSQSTILVQEIRNLGLLPIAIHHEPQDIYSQLQVQQFSLPIPEWIAMIDAANYVISVDTATFHIASGLKKPLVGIFSITQGLIYGKYYHTAEIVQGQCPFSTPGCFLSSLCPSHEKTKPCLTELTNRIIKGFEKILKRFPKN